MEREICHFSSADLRVETAANRITDRVPGVSEVVIGKRY